MKPKKTFTTERDPTAEYWVHLLKMAKMAKIDADVFIDALRTPEAMNTLRARVTDDTLPMFDILMEWMSGVLFDTDHPFQHALRVMSGMYAVEFIPPNNVVPIRQK